MISVSMNFGAVCLAAVLYLSVGAGYGLNITRDERRPVVGFAITILMMVGWFPYELAIFGSSLCGRAR